MPRTVSVPPDASKLAVSPSVPGHKEHSKKNLLESALAMDLSRELAIGIISTKALQWGVKIF